MIISGVDALMFSLMVIGLLYFSLRFGNKEVKQDE